MTYFSSMNTVKNRIFGNNATVYLDGELGTEVSGSLIARDILDLTANGYKVTLNINSVGGSVFDGYQIIDAVLQSKANTHVSGIAASMAAIISLFGEKRTANDFAVFMFHAISGGDDQLRDILTAKFKGILEANTSFDAESISNILDSKKNYFYDANEAFGYGVISEAPINTGRPKLEGIENKTPNEIFQIVNKLNIELDMKEVLNKLNLASTASENEVVNKIQAMQEAESNLRNELKEASNKVSDLEKEVKKLQGEVEKGTIKAAETLVNKAVEDGKIAEDSKSEWIEKAKNDYAGIEKLINSIAATHESHVIDPVNKGVIEDRPEQIMKEPSKLIEFVRNEIKMKELKAKNPEAANKMIDAYINLNN